MIQTKSIRFLSDGNSLFGTLYAPTESTPLPGILFIHGAGQATSERYIPWQHYLAEKGYSSFSFDVRGVGKSEGKFAEGSLDNRLQDARNALKTFTATGVVDPLRLSVAGNSMGAHIVARLIEKEPHVKAIILGCAAAYGTEAENKPLDETFTSVIRRAGSWKDSPVFPILTAFPGKICVVYGDQEEVIPQEVQERFIALAKAKGEVHLLKHIGHRLLQAETDEQIKARQQLFVLSAHFLQEALHE